MRHALWCGALALLALQHAQSSVATEQPTPTLHVSTQIVLLDVAVVDRKGRPAAAELRPDDFTITEDGRPQRLLSFEAPEAHSSAETAVFVLDELNTNAADRGYYLVCLEQYLRSQPTTLPVPIELAVLDASSLRIAQPATQNRADLLATVLHLPPSGDTLVNLDTDRFALNLHALELIALKGLGSTSRTAVVWLGPGDGIELSSRTFTRQADTERYIRYMTNTLVEGRTALYVIFPPDVIGDSHVFGKSNGPLDLSAAGQYGGSINFNSLSAQTGGTAYTGTNDLAGAMRNALALDRGAYALSYHPADTTMDGKFRRVRVTVNNPALRVFTKSGYYAPEMQERGAPQTLQVFQMNEAGKSTLSFPALPVRVVRIEHPAGLGLTDFTLSVPGNALPWSPDGEGQSFAELTVGALAFAKSGKQISSDFQNASLMAHTQAKANLDKTKGLFHVSLTLPLNAERVRLVVSSRKNGRLGCLDLSRQELAVASQDQ